MSTTVNPSWTGGDEQMDAPRDGPYRGGDRHGRHQVQRFRVLVVGKLDHPDLHRRVAFLDQTIGDSHVFEVKHSGHTPTLEAPATLARGIREFLGSLNWDSRKACRDAAGGD